MEIVLLIGLSLLALILFYFLIKASIKRVDYPLVTIFFLIKFFIFAYIGPNIHVLFEGQYQNIHMLNQWILSTSVLLFLPLGMLLVTKITRFDGIFVYDFKQTSTLLDKKMFYVLSALFLLSVTVLGLYIEKLEMLPIIAVVKGMSVEHIAELRSAAGNTFSGKYYRYAIFMKDLPLFLMIILFFMRNVSKRWNYFFIILVAYNIFVSIMDVQKAPLLIIFLILILSSFFYYKKIAWKKVLIFSTLIGVSIMLMYSLFLGYGTDLYAMAKGIMYRLFFAQIDAFIFWQEYLDVNGFQWGHTLPNPAHIFPYERINMPFEVYKFNTPNWEEGTVLGTFPTVFYAEWYANFSYVGAFASMIFLGALLQGVDIFFNKMLHAKHTLILLALYIYLVNYFSKFALQTFAGIPFDMHLIFPVVVAVLLHKLHTVLIKRRSS